jgi:hypothetical protein
VILPDGMNLNQELVSKAGAGGINELGNGWVWGLLLLVLTLGG